MRYPGAARITRRQELERIRKEGRTLTTSALIARVSPSPFSSTRVGIIVPRFGHSAVDRNRLKRRLRELVRLEILPARRAVEMVIWARASAYELSYAELQATLRELLDRLDSRISGRR